MIFYLNGERVSEADYVDTLSDLKERVGLDGFFETIACMHDHIPLQEFHLARLNRSATELGLEPDAAQHFESDLGKLDLPEKGVVKYQILFEHGKKVIHRLLEIQPSRDHPKSYWQDGVSVLIGSEALPLKSGHHGMKSIKRALYERATKEYALGNCAEALMLNTHGAVVEGTKTNVFGIKEGCLITPDLSAVGVAGVMRAFIIQRARALGLSVRVETVTIENLLTMDAVFVSNALIGLWSVNSLFESGKRIKQWDVTHPVLHQIKRNLPNGFVHA